MEFSGKRILVTGAGKGIGRTTVELLVERGATVVALSRSQADLVELKAAYGVETIQCDLADMEATRAAAKAVQPIDLLVNNAGTTILEPFLEVKMESFDELMNVNCKAALVIAQETAKSMIARGVKGAIVNVSSLSSFIGFADHAAYCASKGALDSLTTVMANELGRHGIRVNVINPVVTLTPMAVKAWSDEEKSSGMLKRIPMGRFVEPREVSELIAYLISDRSSMINGAAIPIDGGFLIN